MDTLRQSLAISPADREAFEKAERQRNREEARNFNLVPGQYESGSERMVAAEAKRQRRRERNLLHCS